MVRIGTSSSLKEEGKKLKKCQKNLPNSTKKNCATSNVYMFIYKSVDNSKSTEKISSK